MIWFEDGKKNGLRRCVYTDGDSEDLSLKALQALARLYPKSLTMELAEKQDMEAKATIVPRNKIKGRRDSSTDNHTHKPIVVASIDKKEDAKEIKNWLDIDECDVFNKASQILPPVEVSEQAGSKRKKKCSDGMSDDESSSDEEWLTAVATGLLTSSKSSKSGRRKYQSENEGKEDEVVKSVSLADIKQGERHGCRVINIKIMDNHRGIVGEVS